ncbi:MAG: hypothetical protein U9R49_04700, partial [Bacteroidota bacterium]|nr:hypothetical protein [Bacteroidota bacterium]
MIIRNISIRSLLIMTSLVLVLLLSLLTLVYMDASRRVVRHSELLAERSKLNIGFLSLQNNFHSLSPEEKPGELSDLLQQIHHLEEQIRVVISHEISSRDERVTRKAEQILSLLENFERTLRINNDTDRVSNMQARTDMDLLGAFMEELNLALSEAEENARKRRNLQMGLSMALGIFILANYLIIFTMNLTRAFR